MTEKVLEKKRVGVKGGKREGKKKIENIDKVLLEKTEWFMTKISKQVNNNLKKWKLPIRVMKKHSGEITYYYWAEQRRKPKRGKEGYFRGEYKYLGTNFIWKEISKWNRKKRKINPKRGWIFSFTGKKLSRWNKELQRLYRVRRSIKKIIRDKKRAEEKMKRLIVDLIGVFWLVDLKYCVKRNRRFYWVKILDEADKGDLWELGKMLDRIKGVIEKKEGMEEEKKKWLKEISKAKKKIEKITEERKKIHKRVGKKLRDINKRIVALDKLWYPTTKKVSEN